MATGEGKERRPTTDSGPERGRARDGAAGQSSERWDNVEGEGSYKAAREFDEAEAEFVQSGRLDEGIRNAAPKSDAERREMEQAEARAKRRAKEEDPALLKKPPTSRQGKR